MTQPVSAIRNLGPKSVASYARAGIHDAQTLREIGPDEAYRRLVRAGTRPHFIGYYALVLGLQGRPWTDLGAEEKSSLRQRFDALTATTQTSSALEAELDRLGVIPGKPD